MPEIESRWLVYGLWGIVVVVAWGKVFTDELGEYRALPDSERRRGYDVPAARLQAVRVRAFRGLVSDFALFIVALFSFLSLVVLIFGQEIPGLRGFFLAVALGAFAGAGIIRAWPDRRPTT